MFSIMLNDIALLHWREGDHMESLVVRGIGLMLDVVLGVALAHIFFASKGGVR